MKVFLKILKNVFNVENIVRGPSKQSCAHTRIVKYLCLADELSCRNFENTTYSRTPILRTV